MSSNFLYLVPVHADPYNLHNDSQLCKHIQDYCQILDSHNLSVLTQAELVQCDDNKSNYEQFFRKSDIKNFIGVIPEGQYSRCTKREVSRCSNCPHIRI